MNPVRRPGPAKSNPLLASKFPANVVARRGNGLWMARFLADAARQPQGEILPRNLATGSLVVR